MDDRLVRHRLERSRQALSDAEALLSDNRLHAAVNRMYYSMFYAAVALLKTKDLASSKHSGVRAMFNRHFVKTGVVPKEIGRFYEKMFNERQEGDYIDYSEFTLGQVGKYFANCKVFTEKLWEIVNGMLAAEEK